MPLKTYQDILGDPRLRLIVGEDLKLVIPKTIAPPTSLPDGVVSDAIALDDSIVTASLKVLLGDDALVIAAADNNSFESLFSIASKLKPQYKEKKSLIFLTRELRGKLDITMR